MNIERMITSKRAAFEAVTALMLSLLSPLYFADVPPLLDYPNHLARLWLLTGGAAQEPVNRFYAIDWSGVRTNIGIDLLAVTIGRVMPYVLFGKLMVALAIVLPPAGAVALNARLFQGFGLQRVLLFSFAWMLNLFLGFLNFQMGLGLALLFAAADGRVSRFPPWVAVIARAALSAGLLVVHPFAVIFYGALLAGLGLGRAHIDVRAPSALLARIKPAVWKASATLAPVLVFAALPGKGLGASHLSHNWVFNDPLNIPLTLISPFRAYAIGADVLFGLGLVALVYYAATRGRLAVHAGLLWASAGLFALAMVMPKHTPYAAGIHLRLPPMAWLALAASLELRLIDARRMVVAYGLAVSLVSWRTATICSNWQGGRMMATSVAGAVGDLPVGSRLVVAAAPPTQAQMSHPQPGRLIGGGAPSYSHFGELATPLRGAFVPGLFAEPGKQPIAVRAPYADSAILSGGELISVTQLASRDLDFGDGWRIRNWRDRFDYVLLLNADSDAQSGAHSGDAASRRQLPGLTLVQDRGFARLYRLDRSAPPSARLD